ncbi:MAG: ABC transporter permease [Jatrophihabitantaceae bacterium]
MNLTYMRYELLRLMRNKRFFIFSLGFPLVLFLTIAGSNKNTAIDLGSYTIKFPLYYMVGMAGYGAMIASIAGGARIAAERSVGWNRQLRLTPLRPRVYFRTKVLTSYLMAAVSIALLYVAGIAYGVRIDPIGRWFEMTLLLLIGLAPFIALGVLAGHLLTIDSMGPALGGGSAFFGFLGGQWFPLPNHGALHYIGEAIPSYWLTQASHVGIGGNAWGALGWGVIIAWTTVVGLLAMWAYRRDTQRV